MLAMVGIGCCKHRNPSNLRKTHTLEVWSQKTRCDPPPYFPIEGIVHGFPPVLFTVAETSPHPNKAKAV